MTAITAALVGELRTRTGAGMMECKKALEAVSGDVEAAIVAMRKSGQAKAAKKAGRVAAEGVVVCKCSDDGKTAVVVEVNCETDFVARDNNFLEFANMVAASALKNAPQTIDQLPSSVSEARENLIAKLGENINVRRMALMASSGSVGCYVHSNNRIAALVQLSVANKELGKDIAMHIAASKPLALSADDLSQDMLNKEKEIYLAQVQASGKPPAILEKMITGRMQKFIAESALVMQPFVKNPDVTVGELAKKADAKIEGFIRFEVGEGIEKETVDFAAEVMAQVNKK